jgi:polyisoprenoid-binding protein YceI
MRMARLLLPAVIALSALAPATSAYAGPFDGNWTVDSASNRADCGGNKNEISVVDGKVSGHFQGRNRTYVARGKISDEGKVKIELDGGYVTFKGKVEGDAGSGTWHAVGHCRGSFSLTRN